MDDRVDSAHAVSAVTIDLNADVGESFGSWRLGSDEELMPLISSANIACGFHAGDPLVIRRAEPPWVSWRPWLLGCPRLGGVEILEVRPPSRSRRPTTAPSGAGRSKPPSPTSGPTGSTSAPGSNPSGAACWSSSARLRQPGDLVARAGRSSPMRNARIAPTARHWCRLFAAPCPLRTTRTRYREDERSSQAPHGYGRECPD